MKLAAGDTLGSYRILRQLGEGGMGAVYEVEHLRLGVHYALKTFSLDGGDRPALRRRFLAEGRLLARLRHPRVVRVYDMDFTDKVAWFVMDYVVGPEGEPCTLAGVPRAGLSLERHLADWYEDVREALQAVHAVGVIHRDIKLENILISPDGHAVLSDFGISKVVDDRLRVAVDLTRTMVTGEFERKTVIGTLAYLAPELRARGETTPAVDMYALGVAFFRLLTGIWYEPGPSAFELLAPFSPRWRTILKALLAQDPSARVLLPFRPPPARRHFPLRKALMVVSAVFLAIVAYFVFSSFSREKPCFDDDSASPFAIPDTVT